MNRRAIKKADLILIGVILAAALLVLGLLTLTRQTGSFVVVRVDGTEVARYSLTEDRTETIEGVNGGTNVLVIENSTATMTDADCPDQLCVHQGSIRYDGETIVCLPHRVVVEIEGGEEAEVDGVAG
ncbi:MAG: NusG domain II-containing protein [Lachnospiraceae bacterium]|nr:NusG domain II-containing protein [Lachnospiraceae bacterium]